ncbi:hypothetical protein KJ562_02590 [Patescibacteria group bacterium]|nr:hypothetical protein [Patescibacteria group bacterium]MBU4162357.1 hypothetical protein [Patescibacteria group bacterium]
MENKQIIAQLKALRAVSPEKEWVENTKSFVLNSFHSEETAHSRGFLFFFQPARLIPLAIPAFIVMIVAAGITAHFYLQTLNGNNITVIPTENTTATYLVLAQTKLDSLAKPGDIKEVADMLDKAVSGIQSASKDPIETDKIVKSIADINKKVEALGVNEENAEEIAELKDKASVLSSKTAEALEENIQNTTKELVKNLIDKTEDLTLTDKQAELFSQAKTDYNNENFSAALEKILMLTNNK